jgi:Methyltransferase domain
VTVCSRPAAAGAGDGAGGRLWVAGRLGGFVPALLDGGYQAVGVDPEAPESPDYRRVELEHHDQRQPVECVVASLSLHHVTHLGETLDRLAAMLVPGGVLVVVEWVWERFDEATAHWCLARSPGRGGVSSSRPALGV